MKRVIFSSDLKPTGEITRLRYCNAYIRVDEYNYFEFISYNTIIMAGRLSERRGYIDYVEFFPYCSMTTWAHVRKFCYLFGNGGTVYSKYREAARGKIRSARFF